MSLVSLFVIATLILPAKVVKVIYDGQNFLLTREKYPVRDIMFIGNNHVTRFQSRRDDIFTQLTQAPRLVQPQPDQKSRLIGI